MFFRDKPLAFESNRNFNHENIKHLFLNQLNFLFIFHDSFDLNIIKRISDNSIIINDNNIHLLWNANAAMMLCGKEDLLKNQKMYLYLLKESKNNQYVYLYNIITNAKPNSMCNDLFYGVFKKMFWKNRGIIEAISPTVDSFLDLINPALLFKKFGLDIFRFKKNITIDTLQGLPFELVNSSTISNLMESLVLIENQIVQKSLQVLIMCNEPFPKKSILFNENWVFTLVNESICKEKHFLNSIVLPSQRMLINGDIEGCIRLTNFFPDLQPFILLSRDDILNSEPNNFLRMVQRFENNKIHPIASSVFNRVLNDDMLLKFVENILGISYDSSIFIIKSIPNIFVDVLFNIDPNFFIKYSKLQYYYVSDNDRIRDFSFFFGLKAIIATLDIVTHKENTSFSVYLDRIEDLEVRDSIVIDIFSLIFLQNKYGDYFCDILKAQSILFNLSSYIPSTYFNPANAKLTFARMHKNISLQTALISPLYVVLNVIKSEDYDFTFYNI